MTERLKSGKGQYPVIIGFIVLLWMALHVPSVPVHLLHAREAVDGPDSDKSTNDAVDTKITCLQVIREDYEGSQLSYPNKVLADPVKKEIYVTDSGNNRILVYTHDFYPLLSIGKPDGIEVPVGLAVNPEGYLFIAQAPTREQKKGRISVLNPCLRWKKDIFFNGFKGADNFHPTNIAITKEGRLYVTGTNYRGVVVLNKDGTFSHLLTPTDKLGKGSETKATICDAEIDNQGNIYLLSEDMGRIYVYDRLEQFMFKFGQKGGSSGKLSRPRGVAVDSRNNRVYVIDYMRHTAGVYSDDGRFLFEFGGMGWGKGWFQYPTDIAVDTFGNILVADTFNNRVQVLKMAGIPAVAKVEKAKPKVPVKKKLIEQVKPEVSTKEKPVKRTKPKAPVKEKSIEQVKPEIPVKEKLAKQKPVNYYILTANINLRGEHTTQGRVIRLMDMGEVFEILDQYKHDELNHWYFIKTKSGSTGWFPAILNGQTNFMEKKHK
ncbi:MAG: hypothetical protein HWN69_04350 [Desulfobacterales bacterium]|nr:hypothetical protein [Desulfobacterales bacterium]